MVETHLSSIRLQDLPVMEPDAPMYCRLPMAPRGETTPDGSWEEQHSDYVARKQMQTGESAFAQHTSALCSHIRRVDTLSEDVLRRFLTGGCEAYRCKEHERLSICRGKDVIVEWSRCARERGS